METEGRCEIFRVQGFDPTGENAIECNQPADYCPVCEVFICRECHLEAYSCESHQVKKAPSRAEVEFPQQQQHRSDSPG